MTAQESFNREALEAITQLTDLCQTKNAEQLAQLEAQFTIMGLGKLAAIIFGYGIGNAGDEYLDIRHNAIQAKFS